MTIPRQIVLHGLAVVLASAYPLSLMLRANLGIVPIPIVAVVVILAANVGLAGVLFLALRVIATDVAGRAAWLSVFFLVMGLYVAAVQQLATFGWPIRPDWPLVGVTYTGLSAAIATIVARPRRVRPRDPIPLLMIGLVLFGTNTMVGVSRMIAMPSALTEGHGDWRSAAAALVANATGRSVRASLPERDVYYIILDGFGDVETIDRIYDLDLTDLATYLTARGFYVVPHSKSNYVQTYLSIASTLNLDYLDGLATAVGSASSSRVPLAELIDRNALMILAKRAGYYVVGIGSDYHATERLSVADRCICEQHGSDSTVQALFAATPMLTHVFGSRFVDGHRRKVLDAFRAIEHEWSKDQRVFVFAHLIAPHPPFVFEPNGDRPAAVGSILFQDGSAFGGTASEYRHGYRGQVQFVAERLKAVVEALLNRPGPRPVIVLHGDHGPGLGLNWQSAERTDMAERTGIFAAYYFPDAARQPHAGMTPVNGARILSNEYFGTDFPLIADKTYFSTWGRPYDFVPVSTPETVPSASAQ